MNSTSLTSTTVSNFMVPAENAVIDSPLKRGKIERRNADPVLERQERVGKVENRQAQRRLSPEETLEQHKPHITTTSGIRGWFAVEVHWHPDGFWEPWQSGIGSHDDELGAIHEAINWAIMSELPYVPRKAGQ